jgi:hypothetical protein
MVDGREVVRDGHMLTVDESAVTEAVRDAYATARLDSAKHRLFVNVEERVRAFYAKS